jgi:hypothetical protein
MKSSAHKKTPALAGAEVLGNESNYSGKKRHDES